MHLIQLQSYIDFAKKSKNAEIISGGKCDDSVGYFIEPTVIVTTRPKIQIDGRRNFWSGSYNLCLPNRKV